MKRIIITGGAGFVGNAVIRELLHFNVEVWAVVRPDFFSKSKRNRLSDLKVNIVECDLAEISRVPDLIKEQGFDAWYQFAWDGLAGDDLINYHKQIANVEYVMNSIVAASQIGCKKFIGAGSISQYELLMETSESQLQDKHRVYKTAKYACQCIGKGVAAENGIDFIWPIITNIYGAGEKSPRLINTMIRNLQANKHQSLSDGNQIYDFIYITDAAKAFRLIGEKGISNHLYVIAQGKAKPLKEYLETVRDVVAPEAKLGFGELVFNGYYLPKEYYSTKLLEKDTGFFPEITFAKGIKLTADWIKENDK